VTSRARPGPPLPDAVQTQHGRLPRVRVARSRPVADACGAPVLRDQDRISRPVREVRSRPEDHPAHLTWTTLPRMVFGSMKAPFSKLRG
jgi:hypothetical protein